MLASAASKFWYPDFRKVQVTVPLQVVGLEEPPLHPPLTAGFLHPAKPGTPSRIVANNTTLLTLVFFILRFLTVDEGRYRQRVSTSTGGRGEQPLVAALSGGAADLGARPAAIPYLRATTTAL